MCAQNQKKKKHFISSEYFEWVLLFLRLLWTIKLLIKSRQIIIMEIINKSRRKPSVFKVQILVHLHILQKFKYVISSNKHFHSGGFLRYTTHTYIFLKSSNMLEVQTSIFTLKILKIHCTQLRLLCCESNRTKMFHSNIGCEYQGTKTTF